MKVSNTPPDTADHRETALTTRESIAVLQYKSLGRDESTDTYPPSPMFEILYAINVAFKAFGLPGLCVLSMAIEWRTARWLSLRMPDDTGHDKTSAVALKNAQSVPGAYKDEILLLCLTPRLRSSSIREQSLPGSRISIMSYIDVDICASPVKSDGGASLAQALFEDPQSGDGAGCLSDNDVRFFRPIFNLWVSLPSIPYLLGHRHRLRS